MKIWKKIKIKNKDKSINQISHSLTNYLFKYGPINEIYTKYNITEEERKILNQYTTNRVAGLFLLYITKDKKKINDIINKYNQHKTEEVIPEVEGYIEK